MQLLILLLKINSAITMFMKLFNVLALSLKWMFDHY